MLLYKVTPQNVSIFLSLYFITLLWHCFIILMLFIFFKYKISWLVGRQVVGPQDFGLWLSSNQIQKNSIPAVRMRTTPAIRLTGQDAGPERGASTAAGLRRLPGPFLLDHCPSFTNPAAQRGHQIPCLFWTLFPFGHFVLLFMLNKSHSKA